jgi:hypothetical protein
MTKWRAIIQRMVSTETWGFVVTINDKVEKVQKGLQKVVCTRNL